MGIPDVHIIDIDVETGGSSNTITVELGDQSMVDKMRRLDGISCLGEQIRVRKLGEETTKTNA